MDERTRRVGHNEALFRTVNEELEKLQGSIATHPDDLEIVCECGDLSCGERILVSLADYEDARADAALFVVLPGHEKPATEDVIATTASYLIVRKHEGGPQQLAEATDPRS